MPRRTPASSGSATPALGTHTHLSASALFLGAGAKVIDVPFGEGQATVNLLGGRIEGVVQLPPALIGHVKSGDLRVLGGPRAPSATAIFPDTPTATEAGFPVALDLWRGIVVPKGTPAEVIKKLEEAIRHTVAVAGIPGGGSQDRLPAGLLAGRGVRTLIVADDGKLASVMDDLGPQEALTAAQSPARPRRPTSACHGPIAMSRAKRRRACQSSQPTGDPQWKR